MSALRELQGAMRAGVLGGDAQSALALILPDGLTPEGRLALYRNNTLTSLTAALKATFPVVCRLVEERFFSFAAARYIRQRPPAQPCLAEYGADFADFLAAFEPVRHLHYLPDVARLEWAVNLAYHAPDASRLDPAALAAVRPERQEAIAFVLHPSSRLVASPYPIELVWRANQPEGDGVVDLGIGSSRLLVWRRELDVHVAELGAAGFAFADALAAGRSLGAAYRLAAAVEPDFDLTVALHRHFARGTFAGFVLPESSDGENP